MNRNYRTKITRQKMRVCKANRKVYSAEGQSWPVAARRIAYETIAQYGQANGFSALPSAEFMLAVYAQANKDLGINVPNQSLFLEHFYAGVAAAKKDFSRRKAEGGLKPDIYVAPIDRYLV